MILEWKHMLSLAKPRRAIANPHIYKHWINICCHKQLNLELLHNLHLTKSWLIKYGIFQATDLQMKSDSIFSTIICFKVKVFHIFLYPTIWFLPTLSSIYYHCWRANLKCKSQIVQLIQFSELSSPLWSRHTWVIFAHESGDIYH